MDLGALILRLLLAAACSMGVLRASAAIRRRRPRRWIVPGVLGACLVATAAVGAHFRHVYWLDEPLYDAAAGGDAALVEALLAAGACPDAAWEDVTPALAAARRAGHAEVAAALRRAGAVEPPGVLGLD
jgi:hypothetical protein